MTTTSQDQKFKALIGEELPNDLLDTAIDWIKKNLQPDDVFEDNTIMNHLSSKYSVDDVYDSKSLEDWALSNGYVKKEGE